MIKSMTGFSRARRFIPLWGTVNLEIRSVNHRFLDVILHLPEGFLYLEQRIKDEIARKIRRGHIICRLEVRAHELKKPTLNKRLIKEYFFALKNICRQLKLNQDININTLMGLPGVCAVESHSPLSLDWSKIKPLVKEVLDRLVQRRQQEGRVLYRDLKMRVEKLDRILKGVKARFKRVIKQRLELYETDLEKNNFLRSSDISEEIVRLSFHLRNFARCLHNKKAVGKELDFILQEMQRETNTIGAKSIDTFIASRTVRIKSEIENMREQVQNVE